MIDTLRPRLMAYLLALVLAPLALVPLGGCGYSLAGRGSALPAHIKTIGVRCSRTHVGVRRRADADRAVRLEFIGRGRYKVVPGGHRHRRRAEGRHHRHLGRPTAFDEQSAGVALRITVVVKVEFRDVVNDKVLYENPSQTFKEERRYDRPVGLRSADLPRPELERAGAPLRSTSPRRS